MKGKIKAITVDKYLFPIRQQIVAMIDPKSTIHELGCGNGDLLFHLSTKIKHGIGWDYDKELLRYAEEKKQELGINHLEFKAVDLLKSNLDFPEYDYSLTSLVYHLLPHATSQRLILKQLNTSKKLIICGFSRPENFKQSLLLGLDQRFTKHYHQYKIYKQLGYTEGLLKSISGITFQSVDTFDPVIKIYIVEYPKS